MQRSEAIEYLEKLIKEDQDLSRTQKSHAVIYSHLAIYSGALSYRRQSNLKKYFDFVKRRILKE